MHGAKAPHYIFELCSVILSFDFLILPRFAHNMEACQLVPHQVIIIRCLQGVGMGKYGAKTEGSNLGTRRDDVSLGRD